MSEAAVLTRPEEATEADGGGTLPPDLPSDYLPEGEDDDRRNVDEEFARITAGFHEGDENADLETGRVYGVSPPESRVVRTLGLSGTRDIEIVDVAPSPQMPVDFRGRALGGAAVGLRPWSALTKRGMPRFN